jgi:uncharacterized SAM-binding protein YcdF (DUF218 family)
VRLVIVVLLAVIVALTAQLFVFPVSGEPKDADAVVIFSGGRGERLAKAEDLMRRRVAPILVISNGTDPKWPQANRWCEQAHVRCPRPSPDNTEGEAKVVAQLASDERWDSVVLVTSTYHATRAGMLLRRCVDDRVDVDVVAAKPRQGALRTWAYAAKEWLAVARAQVDRDC